MSAVTAVFFDMQKHSYIDLKLTRQTMTVKFARNKNKYMCISRLLLRNTQTSGTNENITGEAAN